MAGSTTVLLGIAIGGLRRRSERRDYDPRFNYRRLSLYRRRERLETHFAGLERQAGNFRMLTPAHQGTAGNNKDGHRSPA